MSFDFQKIAFELVAVNYPYHNVEYVSFGVNLLNLLIFIYIYTVHFQRSLYLHCIHCTFSTFLKFTLYTL